MRPVSVDTMRASSRASNLVAVAALAVAVVSAIGSLPRAHWRVPRTAAIVGHTVGLDQRWNMFAPHPVTRSIWLVGRARLADGSEVDPLWGGAPRFDKPEDVQDRHPNERWRKLTERAGRASRTAEAVTGYLCERAKSYGDVVSVELFRLSSPIDAGDAVRSERVGRRLCDGVAEGPTARDYRLGTLDEHHIAR
jgi:hypothetical protein